MPNRLSFLIQGGMSNKAKKIHAIVYRDNNRTALICELTAVVIIGLASHFAAAIAPIHNRELLGYAAPRGAEIRHENIQIKTVFIIVRRPPRTPRCSVICAQDGPKATVFFTPFQDACATGGRQRKLPTGGSANGMPRNSVT